METRTFLAAFLPRLEQTFGNRIWFCGLQGSRSRAEHRPDSDVDMVVILNSLQGEDILRYRRMVDSMAEGCYACGFLGSREDLACWLPADLLSLCLDTVPLIGGPDKLAGLVGREAAWDAAWAGVCNIYHGCVHNMIYGRSVQRLRALIKETAFVVRAAAYAATGVYPRSLKNLPCGLPLAAPQLPDPQEAAADFDAASAALFVWAQNALHETAPHAGSLRTGGKRQELP